MTDVSRQWWERRPYIAALILLAAVPLLYPRVPPLVDLYGHMGRYRVQLDLDDSPYLQQFYDFQWSAIGNLGVDLLVGPFAAVFGLELAVKLIILAIPPMTVAGFLWVAREVHHRLPPTALFALPFAYSHPFLFGFVNFSLSIALAFLAFGLWLRLARIGRFTLRAILFLPISLIVFFAHTFGWGMLGLLCFSAEAVRQHDRGIGWIRAGANAALHASVMALPIAFVISWRSQTSGGMTFGWFYWPLKLQWLGHVFRDRWIWFDIASLAIVLLLLAGAKQRFNFSRNLMFSALVLFAAYLIMPWTVFGSAFADMRLIPFVLAVAVLAIRPGDELRSNSARLFAFLGIAFYLARLAATTISFAVAADDQNAKFAALDHVPIGARMVTLVGRGCGNPWPLARNSHLGAMAIVRRHAFSNDQWAIQGANLLDIRFAEAGHFRRDPSQMVRPAACASREQWEVNKALAAIPRDAFNYLWTIDLPPHDPRLLTGMRPVWRGPGSVLYEIEKSGGKESQ